MNELDRAIGALLGLAVGDAVGTTLEFRTPGSFTSDLAALTDVLRDANQSPGGRSGIKVLPT